MSTRTQLSIAGIMLLGIFASGCSSQQVKEEVKPEPEPVPAPAPAPVAVSPDKHGHPANRCTKSVSHIHKNGRIKHTHRYNCQSRGKAKGSNMHTHVVRHTHPSGSKKHTHK